MLKINDPCAYTEAILSLFKKVPVINQDNVNSDSDFTFTLNKESVDDSVTAKLGFVFTAKAKLDNIYVGYDRVINHVTSRYGTVISNMNQGFYKSFKAAKEVDFQTMLVDQLLNYISTYGLESLGVDTAGFAYVPATAFDLPEDSSPLSILVIDSIDDEELINRLTDLITTRAALDSDTINNILIVLQNNSDIDFSNTIDSLHNKELKIALYTLYNKVPDNPIDFLRFVVYKKTGNTLLIKNKRLCNQIRSSGIPVDQYFRLASLSRLAEVFHRFKPLWLAFKQESSYMKSVINQIRRLADKYHKPARQAILDRVTSSTNIDMSEFNAELSKVSVFKKISLLNALLYRMDKPESITYYIRNGLAFTEDYQKENQQFNPLVFNTLFNSIVATLQQNVKDKVIYIPDTIDYATPTSAKLFWNNIPYGSSVSLDKNVVIGVHWTNVKGQYDREIRIDLDLHLNSLGYNVGWNTRFNDVNEALRTGSRIVFTGDMTDAPISSGGATEAYFIGDSITDSRMMINLNYYNYSDKYPVNFELIIDNAEKDRLTKSYLINAHTTKFNLPGVIDKASEFIGILDNDSLGNKTFYFISSSVCKKNVSSYNSTIEKAISSVCHACKTSIRLKSLLMAAGAIIVDNLSEVKVIDIDLSPVSVTKDIFLSLFAE